MDSMMRMSPEQRRARMAEHQRTMTQMMDMMSSDSGMPMSGDPAWRALRDSLRADLGALAQLEGEELVTRLREHTKRVERLLAMHDFTGTSARLNQGGGEAGWVSENYSRSGPSSAGSLPSDGFGHLRAADG